MAVRKPKLKQQTQTCINISKITKNIKQALKNKSKVWYTMFGLETDASYSYIPGLLKNDKTPISLSNSLLESCNVTPHNMIIFCSTKPILTKCPSGSQQ